MLTNSEMRKEDLRLKADHSHRNCASMDEQENLMEEGS
jgi:hypothetical protein